MINQASIDRHLQRGAELDSQGMCAGVAQCLVGLRPQNILSRDQDSYTGCKADLFTGQKPWGCWSVWMDDMGAGWQKLCVYFYVVSATTIVLSVDPGLPCAPRGMMQI